MIDDEQNERANSRRRVSPLFRWLSGILSLCSGLGFVGAIAITLMNREELFTYQLGVLLAACMLGFLLFAFIAVTGGEPYRTLERFLGLMVSDTNDDTGDSVDEKADS